MTARAPGRRYARVRDLAHETGIGSSTIYEWLRGRRIPSIRISKRCVLVPRDAWERFLEQHQVEAVREGGAR